VNVNRISYEESITLRDQDKYISSVFYLKSAKWICCGSNDSVIYIYDSEKYTPILKLTGHSSTVCAIAEGVTPFSIISGSWDTTARIWSINEQSEASYVELKGHEMAVWTVASLPEVQKIITGSADKKIYYWNTKGEKLRMIQGHTDCVRSIITFFDNSFASAANDATIRYWNDDGECVSVLNGHNNYIYAIAKNSSVGEKVIISCGEDSTIRMWNLDSGKQLGEPMFHPAQSVWTVACLDNGDIVTGSSDGIVRIFTKDETRFASPEMLKLYERSVETLKSQANEEIGGIKKTE